MSRTPLAYALSALLTCTLATACSRDEPAQAPATTGTATPAAASPAPAPAQVDSVYRFKIGALDAMALRDGALQVPNDGKTFALGEPVEDVAALLSAAGQPTDVLQLSLQPLLVRSGERVLLFDTGGGPKFAQGGQLPAALQAAGVAPADVTDVFLSHKHFDHVGGLVTAQGAPAFPNARVHLSEAEWTAFQADESGAAVAKAVAGQVQPFKAGAELVPGVVTAVADAGHTPGHSAFLIGSGNDRLLYIGDTAHHFVVSMQEPDWTIAFDEDEAMAERQRRILLQRAVDENLRTYAVHFPFPGLGRVQSKDAAFAWAPEQ